MLPLLQVPLLRLPHLNQTQTNRHLTHPHLPQTHPNNLPNLLPTLLPQPPHPPLPINPQQPNQTRQLLNPLQLKATRLRRTEVEGHHQRMEVQQPDNQLRRVAIPLREVQRLQTEVLRRIRLSKVQSFKQLCEF